jgi:hypothetical protein
LLLLAPVVIAGCPLPDDVLTSAAPWVFHVIEDRFAGADGVKFGDLNGDGLMDAVVPWEESGVVTVHLHPGPAQVRQPWPTVQIGQVAAVEDAVFVDLDSDGQFDVVSCSQGDVKTMHVHWAPVDPSRYLDASAWDTEPIPVTQGARKWMFCAPAQIDGKYGIDLVAGSRGDEGQVGWLEAPENPRNLYDWRWHPLRSVGWAMSVVPFDVDDDGLLDIIVSDRKGPARGCFWLRNPGPSLLLIMPWPLRQISGGDDEVMFLDVADLDANSRLDVVVATNRRQLIWHGPAGLIENAWAASRIDWPDRFGTGKGVRVADINLDGQMDIVFTCENAGGKIGVGWLSRQSLGVADYWLARSISGTAGSKFDQAQTLDLDDDGDLDVITTEESSGLGVVWYENPTIDSLNIAQLR